MLLRPRLPAQILLLVDREVVALDAAFPSKRPFVPLQDLLAKSLPGDDDHVDSSLRGEGTHLVEEFDAVVKEPVLKDDDFGHRW